MDCIYCNSADDGGCISWRLYPNDFTDEPIPAMVDWSWDCLLQEYMWLNAISIVIKGNAARHVDVMLMI